ncbi:MAG: S8 family serine peptidase [Verrucomicrobiaceae bacterium]|nr:S8 family serine peptidase [Verrucomicrobiaceae bacterium]
MKPNHTARFAGILACTFLATTAGFLSAQTETVKPKRTIVERYAHQDIKPRNGYDDSWEKKYPAFTADPKGDPDGDGIDNWTEMLDGTDPTRANKPGEIFVSAAELQKQAEAAAVAQAKKVQEWPAKQAELAQTARLTFDGKDADPEFVRNDDGKQQQAVAKRLADGMAARPVLERELNDIATKYGIPRDGTDASGRGWTLIGESPAGPVKVVTQNARAADAIRADDLWPAGLHSWQNTALTRNLTGSGITTSIFEAGNTPGILTGHSEFQGRAAQAFSVTAGNHATSVADVIAGGGVLDVFRNSVNQGKMLRGVAYQSSVLGYDLFDFVTDTASSVSAGHRFSNHSYGLPGGWYVDLFLVNGVPTYLWVWNHNAFTEDPRLGLYSPPSAQVGPGLSSKEMDEFVFTTQVQLPVFAAGNPNNIGPGALPSPFYVTYVNGSPAASTATRDWVNGDDGYDTVLPPGTAKNVLTVGSIRDVISSTVTLSSFSGTGPTDDGRIKPDVVAVGERNTGLGQGGSLFLAHAGSSSAYYDGNAADSQGTVNISGTSFASPQVQGGLALAQQRRAQLLPTAGPLAASTWRAAAIHAAQDIGAGGPDYQYGWGIFDAVGLVEIIEADAALGRGTLIKEFEIAQGQPKVFFVILPANVAGRLTLAWSDPAGNPANALDTAVDVTTSMLVNDINLSAQDMGSGATRQPWVLNPDLVNESAAARSAAATTGVDNRNNVERIDIAATSQARTFKITIAPQGTITSGPQKVSLVITGAEPVKPRPESFGFSGNPNNAQEMAMVFATDPGAYFTVQTSTDLLNGTWSDVSGSSFLAAGVQSTVLVNQNTSETRRFWKLRRGQ